MNDFTKEELELIYDDVSQCDMEYSFTEAHNLLLNKIQTKLKKS